MFEVSWWMSGVVWLLLVNILESKADAGDVPGVDLFLRTHQLPVVSVCPMVFKRGLKVTLQNASFLGQLFPSSCVRFCSNHF